MWRHRRRNRGRSDSVSSKRDYEAAAVVDERPLEESKEKLIRETFEETG